MDTKHYLRLLRTFALAALTVAATAACSDDTDNGSEPLTPPDGNGGVPVAFTADINPGSDANPAGAPGTRTVLTPTQDGGFTVKWKGKDDNPDNADKIHIWADDGGGTLANNGSPKTYIPSISAVSSALEPLNEGDALTVPGAGEWKFTAIYGMQSGIIAHVSPLSQLAPGSTDHIARYDFSVATTKQTVEAGSGMPQNISLKFEHKLSALQLHVTNQTDAELTVKGIRLAVVGGVIYCQKTYDIKNNRWDESKNKTDAYQQLVTYSCPALATGGGAAQDFHMPLFPGYGGQAMTITVITDRGEYTLRKNAPASPGFEAGTNYMTNITIKSSGLDAATETWTEYISTAEQLAAFRNRVNDGNNYAGKTVCLTADIDLTSSGNWTPIGTSRDTPFAGTFDGDGHHIEGLAVDINTSYAGLFGCVKAGEVSNLRVNGNVTTTLNYAGGIVGTNENSTVKNCIFSGNVNGGYAAGGIAGWSFDNSHIAGCQTKGEVTTTGGATGGIAGMNRASTIDDCCSAAKVTANDNHVGGIAGTNENSGSITRCYATGMVRGTNYVGGIVGNNSSSTVTNCLALNPGLERTAGNYLKFGQIVGHLFSSPTIENCAAFKDMTITDAASSQSIANRTGIDGTDLTADECLTEATYTTREFTDANGWAFDTGATWTYLPWNKVFEGWGISADTYRISVPDHINGAVN